MPTCEVCNYKPRRGRMTRKLAKDWVHVHKAHYCPKLTKI